MQSLQEIRDLIKGMKVIYVDDDISISKNMAQLFQKFDIECAIANDGQEGYEMIQNGSFDVIMCDIMMPRKNGIEMINELHFSGINMPIIVISAFNDEKHLHDYESEHVDYYLNKPVSINQLLTLLFDIRQKTSTNSF